MSNFQILIAKVPYYFTSICDSSSLITGIQLDKGGYPQLEQAIKKNVEEAKLVHHPPWALKLIQVNKSFLKVLSFMALQVMQIPTLFILIKWCCIKQQFFNQA